MNDNYNHDNDNDNIDNDTDNSNNNSNNMIRQYDTHSFFLQCTTEKTIYIVHLNLGSTFI